ncbi:hypothetical protein [Marinicrinis lubricantis]|uniref:DUF8042 domain-containing protein n=1 Tax=Marinicrinis lubricantis TaxID=2086470 RepID=A0ABW1ITQ1_9BACL
MQLIFQDQVLVYQADKSGLDQMFNDINERMKETGTIFSHIIINGEVEVYEDPYETILDKINSIEKVEAIVLNEREFINQTILSLHNYLQRAVPSLELLVNGFYPSPNQETWEQFNQFVKGFEWIQSVVQLLRSRGYEQILEAAAFSEFVEELEEALQQQDYTSVSDLLKYEAIPEYQRLLDCVQMIIDQEVVRNDTH